MPTIGRVIAQKCNVPLKAVVSTVNGKQLLPIYVKKGGVLTKAAYSDLLPSPNESLRYFYMKKNGALAIGNWKDYAKAWCKSDIGKAVMKLTKSKEGRERLIRIINKAANDMRHHFR